MIYIYIYIYIYTYAYIYIYIQDGTRLNWTGLDRLMLHILPKQLLRGVLRQQGGPHLGLQGPQ